MIYNPPKQYEASGAGSTVSSVGSIVSAIPGPVGMIGSVVSLVGGAMQQSEQKKVKDSYDSINDYNQQYTKKQNLETAINNSILESQQVSERYGQQGGRSYVRRFGASNSISGGTTYDNSMQNINNLLNV